MELDLECPESNWIFPSWISVGLIYSGLGYMWIWSKKKKMDHWISYMQNPKIHGSPSIKHPVLGIHETRVTPPSVPGHRQSPGRCNGKSAHDGWVAAPTSWGRRRGWLGCWRGWVRCWAGRCCRKVVLVPAHAIPCSSQHGGEVGQCQVHLGLLPSQKWAMWPGHHPDYDSVVAQSKMDWGLSVLGVLRSHGSWVRWSAGVSAMPEAAAGKGRVRCHSDELEPRPSPLNCCNLNLRLRQARP